MNKRLTAFLSTAESAPEVYWRFAELSDLELGKKGNLIPLKSSWKLYIYGSISHSESVNRQVCSPAEHVYIDRASGDHWSHVLKNTGPQKRWPRTLRSHIVKGDSITSMGKLFTVNSSNSEEHFFYSHTILLQVPHSHSLLPRHHDPLQTAHLHLFLEVVSHPWKTVIRSFLL